MPGPGQASGSSGSQNFLPTVPSPPVTQAHTMECCSLSSWPGPERMKKGQGPNVPSEGPLASQQHYLGTSSQEPLGDIPDLGHSRGLPSGPEGPAGSTVCVQWLVLALVSRPKVPLPELA